MARYRLLAQCVFDGVRYNSGDIIERPDDWKGPMQPVHAYDADGHALFEKGVKVVRDEPLFKKIDEPKEETAPDHE